jgi:hypothetical protein
MTSDEAEEVLFQEFEEPWMDATDACRLVYAIRQYAKDNTCSSAVMNALARAVQTIEEQTWDELAMQQDLAREG